MIRKNIRRFLTFGCFCIRLFLVHFLCSSFCSRTLIPLATFPTVLQFNCFLLMPVVDKLPALLREDLDSAFNDDLDNVFDITNLRLSLGNQKRDIEIELKRVYTQLLIRLSHALDCNFVAYLIPKNVC